MPSLKQGSSKAKPGKPAEEKLRPSAPGKKTNALLKPVQPSPELAAIVRLARLPCTEVAKKVWDDIKRHRLQDAKDKRMIRADATLQCALEGQAHVSMFEMTQLVNRHLT